MNPFDGINMRKLRIIGAGGYNVCLTDGTYAIKIGETSEWSYNKMQKAYENGFGVKVIAYAQKVEIPAKIYNLIAAGKYKLYGKNPDKVGAYINRDMLADVLITELAKPSMSHKKVYSDSYIARMYKRAEELASFYRSMTGDNWSDSHPWNMGKTTDGRMVILDF